MRAMLCLLVCGCLSVNVLFAEPNDFNSIDGLKNEIIKLKAVIEKQTEQLTKLKEENIKLKSLCREAGLDIRINAKGNSAPPSNNKCIYRGKVRDSEWINRMFAKYGNSIADVNGQYVYIQEVIEKNSIPTKGKYLTKIPDGTILKLPSGFKVLQVLKNNEIIIHREAYVPSNRPSRSGAKTYDPSLNSVSGMRTGDEIPEINWHPEIAFPEVMHIKGFSGSYVDRESFKSQILISKGVYKYENTLGSISTIPNLEIYEIKPITTEQFIEAINRGLLLYDYIKGKDEKMEKHFML